MLLKQSTAFVIPLGPFVDSTDGKTLETGLVSALDHASTGIMLSKNGGTLAVRHASVTASAYDTHGCYKVTLDATDTGTLGSLRVIYTDSTTCLPVWRDFQVVPANVYDSFVAGSDALDVSLIQLLGSAPTEGGAGRLAAGLTKLFDVAVPVLTSASVSQTGDAYARIGVPVGASLSVDLAAAKSDTAAVLGQTGTTGVVVASGSKTGYALTSAYDPAKTAAQAGNQMDLVNAPNATALTAIGLAVWSATSRTLSSFGTLVADVAAAVWGAGTRTLTAGTNIVLAKNVGITGLNDISAGAQMDLVDAPNANALTAIGNAVWAVTTRTLSGFGSLVADTATAVWGAGTKILTAATNITSNGATIDQTKIAHLDADISSRNAMTPPTAAANAAAILAATLETGKTVQEALQDMWAKELGVVTPSGTTMLTFAFKAVDGTTTRRTVTVDTVTGARTVA